MKTNWPLWCVVTLVFMLLFLALAQIGGADRVTAGIIDAKTAVVDSDGNVKASMGESMLYNLGAIGNFLLATLGTIGMILLKIVAGLTHYIDQLLQRFVAPATTRSVAVPSAVTAVAMGSMYQLATANTGYLDTSIDDERWDTAEPLLLEAIREGDRRLTISLCERMAGRPYLTEKANATDVSAAAVVVGTAASATAASRAGRLAATRKASS